MNNNGLIIINAFNYNERFQNQTNRLKFEFEKLGIKTDIMPNSQVAVFLGKNDVIKNFSEYDFVVYLDKDKYIARMIEKCGIKIFNKPRSIELCDDKLQTYIALNGEGINMPVTISSPLKFYSTDYDDGSFLKKVIEILSFPIIVKGCYGSLGNQVFLADDMTDLQNLRAKMADRPHLYQQFIAHSRGFDTRVIVVGQKVCAAMLRKSETDFRSNIEQGAKGYPITLTPSYIHIAELSAKILGLDYCGVDILSDDNGEPILCEVNSNAFFNMIEKVSGVNVAECYAKHIYKCVYQK